MHIYLSFWWRTGCNGVGKHSPCPGITEPGHEDRVRFGSGDGASFEPVSCSEVIDY